MRKYSLIISFLALLLSFITKASEKEFWLVTAELQQGMLGSQKSSFNLIQKLENKIKYWGQVKITYSLF